MGVCVCVHRDEMGMLFMGYCTLKMQALTGAHKIHIPSTIVGPVRELLNSLSRYNPDLV